MAKTKKGIYYPSDYNNVADVPEDMKQMAESMEKMIENNIEPEINRLEQKYNEQIKNIASGEYQNAEIVDARLGFDTLGSVIKQKVYHFENIEKMRECLTLIPRRCM